VIQDVKSFQSRIGNARKIAEAAIFQVESG
jgi:hypothetical protein